MRDEDGFVMHGEVPHAVLRELHKFCADPKHDLPPYP